MTTVRLGRFCYGDGIVIWGRRRGRLEIKTTSTSQTNSIFNTRGARRIPIITCSPGPSTIHSEQPGLPSSKTGTAGRHGRNECGCHLHTGVFEFNDSKVSFPGEYSNYEVSDDHGGHWRRVDRGTPKEGQWVRRPLNEGVQSLSICGGTFGAEAQIHRSSSGHRWLCTESVFPSPR